MKTNEIFSWARFGRYAKSMWMLNRKQFALYLTVTSITMYLIIFYLRYDKPQWNIYHMIQMFVPLISIAGIIFSGNAFSEFRNKLKMSAYLMLPISKTEKFIYEFIVRIIVFILVFAFLFLLIAPLSEFSANCLETYNGLKITQKLHDIPIKIIVDNSFQFLILTFFILTIAFAGASTFEKLPVYKTILFVALVSGVIFLYLYLIFEIFHLHYPWFKKMTDKIEPSHLTNYFQGILLLISTCVLIYYSYYKLKEKEA